MKIVKQDKADRGAPITKAAPKAFSPMKSPLPTTAGRDDPYGYHFKLLVSNKVSGAIIGFKGEVMHEICQTSSTRMRISHREHGYYPGTQERIVVVNTTSLQNFLCCMSIALKNYPLENSEGDVLVRGLLHSSSAQKVIGHMGSVIAEIREGCREFSIVAGISQIEHVFTLVGTLDQCLSTLRRIAEIVFEDFEADWYSDWGSEFVCQDPSADTPQIPGGLPPPYNYSRSSSKSQNSEINLNALSEVIKQSTNAWNGDECSVTIDFPQRFVGGLLGRGGVYLQGIQQKTNDTRIHIASSKDEQLESDRMTKIHIKGHFVDVCSALFLIQNRGNELYETLYLRPDDSAPYRSTTLKNNKKSFDHKPNETTFDKMSEE